MSGIVSQYLGALPPPALRDLDLDVSHEAHGTPRALDAADGAPAAHLFADGQHALAHLHA